MKKLLIKSVNFKNFLSYGDYNNKIDFTRKQMTLINGKNGNGKSAIFESLCYGLFGKTIRKIPKSDIVNNKNQKNMLVEVEFSTGGKDYLVKRGAKPGVFEIYENNILLKQDATVKEYQQKLEDILSTSFDIFIQTVVISKTRYVPFMRLDAANRRLFVENLLTLTIFGSMNKKQKVVLNDLKSKLIEMKTLYTEYKTKVEQAEKHVITINNILQESLVEKQKMYENDINELENNNISIISRMKELDEIIYKDNDDTKNKFQKNVNMYNQLKEKLDENIIKTEKLRNGESYCSECGQPLTKEHIDEHINTMLEKNRKLESAVFDLNKKIQEQKLIIEKIEESEIYVEEYYKLQNTLNDNKNNINILNRKKNEIVFDDSSLKTAKKELKEYRSEFNKINDKLVSFTKEYEYNVLAYDLLKDNGIKASIIDKSIPYMNTIINKKLNEFGFFIDFKLDKEFNETIKVRGIDVLTYDSFSEGEKLRIDMAVLLAWREISQSQNNISSNLLIFDEMTDASMDYEGSEILGKMLSELDETNIFIITHTPEKLESFARGSINIIKENGYSRIV